MRRFPYSKQELAHSKLCYSNLTAYQTKYLLTIKMLHRKINWIVNSAHIILHSEPYLVAHLVCGKGKIKRCPTTERHTLR